MTEYPKLHLLFGDRLPLDVAPRTAMRNHAWSYIILLISLQPVWRRYPGDPAWRRSARSTGHANPVVETIVREAMRGIRRSLGVAPEQKRAVTTAEIAAAVAQIDDTALIDVRDRPSSSWATPAACAAPSSPG